MKKGIKKATTWLMVFCMIIGFVPAFSSAAAAKEKPVQAIERIGGKTVTAASAALQSEGEFEELNSQDLFSLLLDSLKEIAKNIRSIHVDELLKLPANAMDDVVTYIFSVFKLFGLNIDSLYELFFSLFFKTASYS